MVFLIGLILGLVAMAFVILQRPDWVLPSLNIALQQRDAANEELEAVHEFWADQGRLPPPGAEITLNGVGLAYIFDTYSEEDDDGDMVVREVFYVLKSDLDAAGLVWATASRAQLDPDPDKGEKGDSLVSSMTLERFLANVTENALDFARRMGL